MRHFYFVSAISVILLAAVACEKNVDDIVDPADNPLKKLELTTRSADFARRGNEFAFAFLDKVNKGSDKDFIVSPLSMQFLLGMILDGAKGQTADEICEVLGYGAGEVGAVNEYCQSMLEQLPELDKATKLSIANAVMVNKNYSLLDSYKSTVSKYFDAEVSNLDFSNNKAATSAINTWCSNHTNGLIPEVIKTVSPSALAYLLNAVYFKSQWKNKFPKENTSNATFTADDGSTRTVKMMRTGKHLLYQDDDILRAVRLPFGNEAYSMIVILPAEGKTLSDVTENLDGESWAKFRSSMVSCDVDLWLPKFETKFHIGLNGILSAMGMPTAFNSMIADFSAMSKEDVCLSSVQQDAVIKVDEDGAEAAAVSMAAFTTAALPGQHIAFHADKPFLYLITESSTGAILFAGKYAGK
ncbi:MAG: serpin family protein [Bacteroidales bacterium]|nr:serpin family protein [Bacteroidales bacterium]